jgi:hypothetical protein
MSMKLEYKQERQLPRAVVGRVIVDPALWQLYCPSEQERVCMVGVNVYHELTEQRVLGAAALEQCLEEQGKLPRQWRAFELCFWGGVFSGSRGRSGIRTIYWNRICWTAGLKFIDSFFTRHQPALVLKRVP